MTTPLGTYLYLPIPGAVPYPSLAWAPKTEGDAIPYTLDCTSYLESINDTIASATATVSPNNAGDLTFTAISGSTTDYILVWQAAAGQPYTNYAILVTITTAAGNTISRYIYLEVEPLSQNRATNPPTVIIQGPPGQNAASLTIQAGSEILSNVQTLTIIGTATLTGTSANATLTIGTGYTGDPV